MKKFSCILLTLLLACLLPILPVVAEKAPHPAVEDSANLLTAEQEADLQARLETISNTYQIKVYIVTLRSIDSYSVDSYVEYYYDSNRLGYGENRDGILLLITMQEREYRILANGRGADALSMSDIDSIGNLIAPDFTDKKYNRAFNAFLDEVEYEIDGEINGFPFDFGMNLLIAVVLGLVLAFIVTGVMKGQLKSVRPRSEATEYMKPGSLKITKSTDLFLYRTVNRQRKESSSSGSGRSGGGSRRVGGGRF